MLLSEIKTVIGDLATVDCCTDEDLDIRHLLIDSRQLGADPEHTLFFAFKTEKDDGARYIPELAARGVRAFVIGRSLEALQALAVYKRSRYQGIVIGITGSNGKTVVKDWLYELLKEDYDVIRSPKSYNSQIGVALSVWALPDNQPTVNRQSTLTSGISQKPPLAIFEAGISCPGEMERLEKMVRPTLGVITYIGEEHGENFTSMEQKRAEKMKLFAHCDTVIEDPTHQNARTCSAVLRQLGYSEDVIRQRILQQTHETVMQVNLSSLVDNVRYFRSCLRPDTRLTCMVKAFAYGSGSVDVSRALQQSGLVDYLAVAVADEGVELRRAGITLPIIIMNPEVAAIDLILQNNLEPNIYSFESLDNILGAVQRHGLENFPVHLKFDSGMHRLGFYAEDVPELLRRLGEMPGALNVRSVFSHLAGADEAQFDDFTHQQIAYFDGAAEAFIAGLSSLGQTERPWKHILNTAGIERFPDYQFDMCRLGIGMYGQSFAGKHLKTVCTLKTTILSLKTVLAGETVGYARRTRLTKNRQIAVIPIGYADGFDRRFSNYGGEVLVRGKRCPVVGNVCMDQAMVDVTGTDARVGDYVTIFGDGLPLEELAARLGTITYEVLTSVSRRVKRQYVED